MNVQHPPAAMFPVDLVPVGAPGVSPPPNAVQLLNAWLLRQNDQPDPRFLRLLALPAESFMLTGQVAFHLAKPLFQVDADALVVQEAHIPDIQLASHDLVSLLRKVSVYVFMLSGLVPRVSDNHWIHKPSSLKR